MKKIYYLLFFVLSLALPSCNNEDVEEALTHKTANANMLDLGTIPTEFSFDIITNNNSDTYKCKIRINIIKTGDTIDTIMFFSSGKELKINIITTPNDFSCNEPSCYSAHELNFDVIGLKKGNFNVNLGINNAFKKPFNIIIN